MVRVVRPYLATLREAFMTWEFDPHVIPISMQRCFPWSWLGLYPFPLLCDMVRYFWVSFGHDFPPSPLTSSCVTVLFEDADESGVAANPCAVVDVQTICGSMTLLILFLMFWWS